jgi:hypothetical protein
MHASRRDADVYAETLRKEGTVLYIQELPALVIRSKAGCLIATQINCDSPLRNYKPYFKMEGGDPDQPEWGIHWLHNETPIRQIVDSLRTNSIWWRVTPPAQNSVIVLASEDPFHQLDRIQDHPTLSRSFTIGSDYWLQWETTKRVIDPEPVRYLERMFSMPHPATFPGERWNFPDGLAF